MITQPDVATPAGGLGATAATDVARPGCLASRNTSWRISQSTGERTTVGQCNAVEEATGRTVLIYVEDEFDDMYGIFEAFDQPTWERSLRRRPEDERWIIWQASDVASVQGVSGGVDLNLMSTECCP